MNLGGEPTWYTLCPVDPNLPTLPLPVHYKAKSHISMEQLLSRFKSNFSTLKFKSSRSMTSSFDLSSSDSTVSLPALMKRRRSVPKGRLNTTQLVRSGSTTSGYQYEDCSQQGENGDKAEEDTKAQMMRLASIINVLKESAENDDAQSIDGALDSTEDSNSEVKKNKLQSILRVLRDDTPGSSSESGDNFEECTESTDGNQLSYLTPPTMEDDGSFSTLDRRTRKRRQQRTATLNPDVSLRPKSDSFNSIPTLRSSLSSRGRSKVPTFSFLEEMNNSVQLHTQKESSTEDLDSMDDDERSDASLAEHYRIVDECQSDNEQEPHPPSLSSSSLLVQKGVESNHIHHTSLPPATVAMTSAKPSDCSCYPAEVSLHRINIVDVDREKIERRKTFSMPSPDKRRNRSMALNLTTTPELKCRQVAKGRSKSLGDMEDLESEEELILVRSPMTPGGELDRGSRDDLDVVVPFPSGEQRTDSNDRGIHEERDEEDTDDAKRDSCAVSSLDFSELPRTRQVSIVHVNDKEEKGEKVGVKGDWNMSKWRSLDNLLTGSLPRK